MTIAVRRAGPDDRAVVAEFNRRLARETESKELPVGVVERGVAAALADPAKGFYLVAESGGEVVGQVMLTTEWSDWRDGYFWWLQSVYVRADFRRRGVFRAMFAELKRLAGGAGDVVGVRLYVERDNATAVRVYESLGMGPTDYLLYEGGV